ncbi:thioredoxin-like protein [Xylaria venustula]|nr:thioredoxin-like protein [Xylaria venustula]
MDADGLIVHSKAEFDEAVKKHPVLFLDAFAVWCGPCKAIAPILADWSNQERFKDVFFAKIDVDALPELSQELGITAMPTFIAFKDGEIAGKFVGARPDKIEELIATQLPPPAPEKAEKAEKAEKTEEASEAAAETAPEKASEQ